MSSWSSVVLAAGLGTRMKSSLPKVLWPVAGRPLLLYPVQAALAFVSECVVVIGPDHEQPILELLGTAFPDAHFVLVTQHPPRGTGDATRLALRPVRSEHVLILCGDTPLVRPQSLARLQATVLEQGAALGLLTAVLADPTGYGRVLRDAAGEVLAVREHRDATVEERQILEVNAGIYAARTELLRASLERLTATNSQGEYYLTDAIAQLRDAGFRVVGVPGDPLDLLGVNDRAQLLEAEELLYRRIAEHWGKAGVTVRGGARIDYPAELEPDATIEHHSCIRGRSRVSRGAVIGVGAVLTDTQVGPDAVVGAGAVLTDTQIGSGATVGAGAVLERTRVGNHAWVGHYSVLTGAEVEPGARIGPFTCQK